MRIGALFAALVSVSCSVVVDPGRHAAGEPLDADLFCTEIANALCEGNANCCDMPVDRTPCVGTVIDQCAVADEVLPDARVAYDARAAAALLAEGRSLADACDPDVVELLDSRRFLPEILAGTVPAGGTCTPDPLTDVAAYLQCERGLICEFGLPDWTCRPPRGLGVRCANSFGCETPLVCVEDGDGMMTCQAPLAVGASCTDNDQCESLNCGNAGVCEARTVESSYFCDVEL